MMKYLTHTILLATLLFNTLNGSIKDVNRVNIEPLTKVPISAKLRTSQKTISLDKAKEMFIEGDYEGVANYFKALSTERENCDNRILLFKSRYLIYIGKYKEAKELLKSGIKSDNNNWEARSLYIYLLRIIGDRRSLRLEERFFTNLYTSGKLKTAAGYTTAGEAFALRRPKLALKLFQKAIKVDDKYLRAYLSAGKLCFDYFAWGKAEAYLKKALEIDNLSLEALTTIALLKFARGDFKNGMNFVHRALIINPKYIDALELKIGALIAKKRYKEAIILVDEILKINPNTFSAYGLLAGYYDAKGDKATRDLNIKKALEINPNDAEIYLFLSQIAMTQYRIPDAVKWSQKALTIDPENWSGYYECGVALLRLGEDKKGLSMLEKSFKLNAFNIPAYNILTVLDREFKGGELVLKESEHFAVKIPKDDVNIIWPYLEDIMEDAYTRFTKQYKVKPHGGEEYNGKILVLILNDPQSFSVRTIGVTGLGAVGVCFGQVLMMPSPRFACLGYGKGFNWKSTFEHEFLHTVTLQKSDYKISRWFTEGISSAYESDIHGNWRRLFSSAGKEKKLLPLETLESGFIMPTYPQQVPVSYYQAALVCKYFEDNFGIESHLEILKGYKNGRTTEEIIPKVCKLSLEEINKKLDNYYQECWKSDNKFLKELKKEAKAESELIKEKEKEKSKKRKPGVRDWEPVVTSWLKKDEEDKAIKYLEGMIAFSGNDWLAFKKLANLYFEKKDYTKAILIYQELFYRNPYDIESHKNAKKCYLKVKNAKLANREAMVIKALSRTY